MKNVIINKKNFILSQWKGNGTHPMDGCDLPFMKDEFPGLFVRPTQYGDNVGIINHMGVISLVFVDDWILSSKDSCFVISNRIYDLMFGEGQNNLTSNVIQ